MKGKKQRHRAEGMRCTYTTLCPSFLFGIGWGLGGKMLPTPGAHTEPERNMAALIILTVIIKIGTTIWICQREGAGSRELGLLANHCV